MNNPTQHRGWILGMHRRVAGAALALAICFYRQSSRPDRHKRRPSPRWRISRAAPMALTPHLAISSKAPTGTITARLSEGVFTTKEHSSRSRLMER